LILGFFSQWGPVQKEFEELMSGALAAIPQEQRTYLLSFILQFKDQYLRNLSQKSGTIGVFAVLILVWIGARVYFNIESLMNRIWSVGSDRPWFERIKNFTVSMVFLPLLYALVISLPGIVGHYGDREAGIFLDQGLLIIVIFTTLTAVLKGFPNTRVSWKSAWIGAASGTLAYSLANVVLRIYFRFGTDTAYGKAGVLPVFAFFIYVVWLIFIFSAEVSLLVERGGRLLERRLPQTTLGSALILEKVLRFLGDGFHSGAGPQTAHRICMALSLSVGSIEPVLQFLEKRGRVVRVFPDRGSAGPGYIVTQAVLDEELPSLLRDYLQIEKIPSSYDVEGLIRKLSVRQQ
jgi:uncharacterized BrkB/YihY/UPF0761 family membrane protein